MGMLRMPNMLLGQTSLAQAWARPAQYCTVHIGPGRRYTCIPYMYSTGLGQYWPRPVQLMSMLRMLMSCTCSAARSMCMLRCAEHGHAAHAQHAVGLAQALRAWARPVLCTRHSFERTHACGVCTAQACARPVQLMSMLRMLMSCTCSAARSMCMLRCAEHGHAAHAQHAAGPVRQCFNCIQGPRPKGLGPRPRA